MANINYRATHGGLVQKAWDTYREATPNDNHAVVPFVAGFNAALVGADPSPDDWWNSIGALVEKHGIEEEKLNWMLCRGQAAEWRFS